MIARAAALGLSIEARAGDVFDVELPVVDRVLLANVLHLEPPPVARAMLSLAHGALEPGGRVVIVDVIPDGRAEGAGEAALYAIQLALRVPTGVVHSQRALSEWLRLEGFEAPQRIGLGPGDALAALVAVRR
jgi:8-O-methyltransferase